MVTKHIEEFTALVKELKTGLQATPATTGGPMVKGGSPPDAASRERVRPHRSAQPMGRTPGSCGAVHKCITADLAQHTTVAVSIGNFTGPGGGARRSLVRIRPSQNSRIARRSFARWTCLWPAAAACACLWGGAVPVSKPLAT